MAGRLDEFQRIERFFRPLAGPAGLDLRDDAALFAVPEGRELVATVDAILEGVHFLSDDPPALIARKLLRVNLSDLAGKGAEPLLYLLTTALPERCREDWLEAFAAGLAQDQSRFRIALAGGDSTVSPAGIVLTVTALGTVPVGAMVRRSGAKPGETIWVSGTLGDAALGLFVRRGGLTSLAPEHQAFLAGRYRLPEPRVELGIALRGLATAMLDVSDGLVADLGHLCRGSGVAGLIERERVPLSESARAALAPAPELILSVLAGGDDYELVFTAPAEAEAAIRAAAAAAATAVTPIGRTEAGEGVRVIGADGRPLALDITGWRHFD